MKNNRPVNLDLTTIQFPISALASITHRISGVALFVAVGFLLWGLKLSLSSEEGFVQVQGVFDLFLIKLMIWGVLSFFIYHLFAGIKHLLMDAGYFETKNTGPVASYVVFGLSIICILLAGVWIW